MKPVARELVNHRFGTYTCNTIEELKRLLGVNKLTLVLLDDLDEYQTLVLSEPDPVKPPLEPAA